MSEVDIVRVRKVDVMLVGGVDVDFGVEVGGFGLSWVEMSYC